MERPPDSEPPRQVDQVPATSAQLSLAEGQRVLVQTTTQPRSSRMEKNYAGKHSTILGALQIACGLVSMAANIAILVNAHVYDERMFRYRTTLTSGYGIWCGLLFFLAGAFAVAAGRRTNRCLIITSMVLSIVAAVFAGIQMLCGVFGILMFHSYIPDSYLSHPGVHQRLKAIEIVTPLLLSCGALQMIVSIWTSSLTCKAACCTKAEPNDVVVRYIMLQQAGNPATGHVTVPVVQTEQTSVELVQTHSLVPPPYSCKTPDEPTAPAHEDNLAFNQDVPLSDREKLWVGFDE